MLYVGRQGVLIVVGAQEMLWGKGRWRAAPAVCCAAALLLSCGGRSTPGPGAAADGADGEVTADAACPMPAALSSQRCRASAERCEVGGVDDRGVRYEMVCDGTDCVWKEGDRVVCGCDHLNYANTCPLGVPTCADWNPPFNWAVIECEYE
jgi:hypothetical protein